MSTPSYCEQVLPTRGGWERGNLAGWDRGLALFPARGCAFLADSQPVLWQKVYDLHGDALGIGPCATEPGSGMTTRQNDYRLCLVV